MDGDALRPQAVGVVLVTALMTLPPATALRLTRRLPAAMALTALLCFLECLAGIVASYIWNCPPGAVIILLSAILFLLASYLT